MRQALLTAVVDTNIWLDLLVFDDPSSRRLADLLAGAKVTSLASPAMRAELADVLGRSRFGLDPGRQRALLTRYDDLVQIAAEPPDCRLACRDPDDRKFLDLAVARRTDWLLSRDRALLAARRPAARRFELAIGTLADFYCWLDNGG
ncbi:MAG: putative toxin-antitoxin system toxin component, PIN family [Lautropia sp.]